MTETERIAEVYGEAIALRARRVERRFAADSGEWGFGYLVARSEDIEQRVYETLMATGVTLEDIEGHPNPLGYIYQLCHHKGLAEAKKARALAGNLALTSFAQDEDDGYEWVAEKVATREPRPDEVVLAEEFDRELVAAARKVMDGTTGQARLAVELWTLSGYTATEVASALGTTYEAAKHAVGRALRSLDPNERAALHAARAYLHPEVKRPKAIDSDPEAVRAILMGA